MCEGIRPRYQAAAWNTASAGEVGVAERAVLPTPSHSWRLCRWVGRASSGLPAVVHLAPLGRMRSRRAPRRRFVFLRRDANEWRALPRPGTPHRFAPVVNGERRRQGSFKMAAESNANDQPLLIDWLVMSWSTITIVCRGCWGFDSGTSLRDLWLI